MKLFTFLFTAIPLLFVFLGAKQAIDQHITIRAHTATTRATVQMSNVEISSTTNSKGRKTTQYTPLIDYTYYVDKQIYESKRVFPVGSNVTQDRAKELVKNYPSGKQFDVFYDPQNPSSAFILREWDFSPYLFALCPILHLSVGLWMMVTMPWKKQPLPAPIASKGGWFELPVRQLLAEQIAPWKWITALWWFLGIVACGHFFLVADRPWPKLALWTPPIYFSLSLIPLIGWFRRSRLTRALQDPILWIDKKNLFPGDTFNVRIEQPILAPVQLQTMTLAIVCDETIARSSSKNVRRIGAELQQPVTIKTDQSINGGTTLSAQQQLEINPALPASSPADQTQFPKYSWRITLHLKLQSLRDFNADFPVQVG